METGRPQDFTIEAGPMGPIGEGEALILRVNRNCPWNRCLFCSVYKGENFTNRGVREINDDIDAIRRTLDLIEKTSWEIGLSGRIKIEAIQQAISNHPEIYGRYPDDVGGGQWHALQTLNNIANWLLRGARRVFLQDANALAMAPAKLIRVLRYIKESLPTVDTITCYARSKTFEQRSPEELKELNEAGLSWCFVGIESGNNEVLGYMKKGATQEGHVKGGKKAMAAGLHIAAFVMPGLAGNERHLAQRHILDTVRVLNEFQPTEVRVRSLAVLEEAPLYQRWKSGDFNAPSEDQMIEELRILIDGLRFDCTFETLQMTNPLFTMKGSLSQNRESMLQKIASYQDLSPAKRACFILDSYVDGGYLDCVKAWGKYDSRLKQLVEDARNALESGSDDAIQMAGRAVFAIKAKGVP